MPAVKSAVILAPWKNKYNPPQTYTSAVSATEHTIGCALWACPACVNLHPTQKTKRRNDSETELIEVSWLPTWEPEELMLSWDS